METKETNMMIYANEEQTVVNGYIPDDALIAINVIQQVEYDKKIGVGFVY